MAEGGTGQSTSIQCGYCLVKDDQMNDPRVLPCSHVFCTSCMIGQYEDVGAVTCPTCSTSFEGDVKSLPQSVTQNSTQLCDACMKKHGIEREAVVFCTTCARKLCTDHQQSHDEVIEGHTMMSIAAFKTEEQKLMIRYCSEHGKRYKIGCQVCKKVLCSNCVNSTNLCFDGKHHELIQLNELESMLKKNFGKGCDDVATKEANIAKLYKDFSKMVSDYEVETTEMVNLLQSTKEEQINAIDAKYKLLEEELLQSRTEVQKQMETFMEEEVNSVLSALSRQRKKIEGKYRSSHHVDVVLEHESTMAKLKELADRKVKDCKIQYIKPDPILEGRREPEFCITANLAMYFSCGKDGLEKWFGLPTSVKFRRSVTIPAFCHSICYVDGKLYVGTDQNTIEVVDHYFNVENFASTKSYLYGIVHHSSKIYALLTDGFGHSAVVNYDSFGKILFSQRCIDSCQRVRPAVVSNHFIVPDIAQRRITIYSISTKLIKHIAAPKLSGNISAITAVSSDSVVVTCHKSSSVLKVNIETGKSIWTCTDVFAPHGVAVYNKNCVCVISYGKLSFINTQTGVVERVISEPKINTGQRLDIAIFNTTIVVSAGDGGLNFFDIC